MYTDLNKYKAGIIPSTSISYQGKDLTFVNDLDCDANLNEVIDRIDLSLKKLLEINDLSTLNARNLQFAPATVSNIEVLQALIDQEYTQQTALNTLTATINNFDISSKLIEIDLGDLTPDAAPCAQGENVYSLISLLNLFASEISSLKNP